MQQGSLGEAVVAWLTLWALEPTLPLFTLFPRVPLLTWLTLVALRPLLPLGAWVTLLSLGPCAGDQDGKKSDQGQLAEAHVSLHGVLAKGYSLSAGAVGSQAWWVRA